MKTLPMTYLSSFCLSLHLASASGIPLSEGILLYAQDEPDARIRSALSGAYDALERGGALFAALRECNLFPVYMTDMIDPLAGGRGHGVHHAAGLSRQHDRSARRPACRTTAGRRHRPAGRG